MISPILLKFAVASYYIGLAIFVPISGWCADRFGIKNVFISAIIAFTIFSIFCGLSQTILQLTLFRLLQGMSGALMTPLGRIILLRSFAGNRIINARGIVFTIALIGRAIGPFIGGIITDNLSWHWIFYINIPCVFLITNIASHFNLPLYSADIIVFHYTFYVMSCIILLAILAVSRLTMTDGMRYKELKECYIC